MMGFIAPNLIGGKGIFSNTELMLIFSGDRDIELKP
jgi:hypothetical protein